MRLLHLLHAAGLFLAFPLHAGVLINEIMYHPVERPAFDAAGDPVLDLTEDVHEFIELKNTGSTAVSLAGWRLRGAADYVFPAGASIPAQGFAVVAKFPARLESIAAYALPAGSVFGPWSGGLKNSGDTIRLETVSGAVADAVSYSSSMPWAIGANAFGAEDDWTSINETLHQYRGRSLERVSMSWPANDPANWLASPLVAGPSPGRANAVALAVPLPVVTAVRAVQDSTGSIMIRATQPVRVEAQFSSAGAGVSNVQVEYFRDDINSSSEAKTTLSMTAVAGQPGLWRATVPGQTDRSIVRYRILTDRGAGVQTVSPRADDPQAWHAWFVSPVRSSTRPSYEIFISAASLSTLSSNISQSPRRIVNPDPPGLVRASWSATQPAVVVRDGVVFDVRMRYHGSRYRRDASRNSFKLQFPRYARLDDLEGLYLKDKGEEHRVAGQIYRAAGLPAFTARYADVYLNSSVGFQRLEVPEMDDRSFGKFADFTAKKYPGTAKEKTGEFYKSTGVVPFETAAGIGATTVYTSSGEGPYYIGNGAPIPLKAGWTTRRRYEYTYGPQMHQWIGGRDTEAMITGLWAARGDLPTAPNPDLPALRAWLAENFDVQATLTYIAIRNWCAPIDDVTHNHYLWRRANGRWAMLPWDLDGEMSDTGKSIYWDEYSVPQPDTLRGPHWLKDSFLKAYRTEYKQRLWLLNNTVMNAANFAAPGYGGLQSFATARQANVNSQLGLGTFHRPGTPVAQAPASLASILPGAVLQTSAYAHSAPAPAPAHTSTTWMIRASGSTWDAPVLRLTTSAFLTSFPVPFDELSFGATYFWKCYYTDADGHPSFESTERSFVFGTAAGTSPEVRLNEVLARGVTEDFIEIHNAGITPAELSGMGLTDDPAAGAKYHFPAGTSLAPGAYRVVALDAAAPFRLDGDGQTVLLLAADGSLADAVSFGPQAADRSLGRTTAGWELGGPTPGAANVPESTGPASALRINEWMATDPDGPDWLELVNPGTQPVAFSGLRLGNGTDTTVLPPLSWIGPGGFQRFIADRGTGTNHLAFKLSSSGESVSLTDGAGALIDSRTFGPQQAGVPQGLLPDAAGAVTSFPGSGSPGEANALAITDIAISRIYPDIELHNRSALAVALDGWFLHGSLTDPAPFIFPGGTSIAPGGTLTVPAASLPFSLEPLRGGAVYLSHGGTHRSGRSYGAWDGNPWGLVMLPDGEEFVRVRELPATPAGVPVVGPVVVREFSYDPPDVPGDNDTYEFVEWQNTSAAAVDISGWRLAGDADFTVPEGVSLPAGGYAVFAPVPPAEFAARYAAPPGTLVLGPWSGSLPDSGGEVRIVRRLPPVMAEGPDFGYHPEVTLERIRYRDTAPWPAEADGTGLNPQRAAPGGYGNDPASWTTGAPSPGAADSPNLPPSITITAPADGGSSPAGTPVMISVSAADPDGAITAVQFRVDGVLTTTAAAPPFTFTWTSLEPGPHALRVSAYDTRLASASAELLYTLANDPPMAAILSPGDGARFDRGTSIPIAVAARDPENLLQRVDFLADGVLIGSASAAPWTMVWSGAAAGLHRLVARATDATGLSRSSQAVTIIVAGTSGAVPYVAWQVPAGTAGTQNFGGSLGMDFEVISPVLITRLGVFDSGSNGMNSTITAQLWRTQPTTAVLAALSFTTASPGTLAAASGSRFKDLTTPLLLHPGIYTMVAYGYSASELNGNSNGGNPLWTTNDGNGLIRFTGTGSYGTAGQYPANADGGPVNRYAAGTMEFTSADSDADCMPQDWETANGFNPSDPSDATGDADGDGRLNREEYAAGTDPRDPASIFRIQGLTTAPGQITVRITLPANRQAVLQYSGELIWWFDQQTIAASGSPRVLDLAMPAGLGRKFVRVAASPP